MGLSKALEANPFASPLTAPDPFGPAETARPTDADIVVAPPLPQAQPVGLETARGDRDPSRQELLQRAAEARPTRRTWESIILAPTDPILSVKMQPHVAQRRARLRRAVIVAAGLCSALFLAATAASAFSAPEKTSHPHAAQSKSAPATVVTPVEKLEIAVHGRAPRHVTAAVAPRWKRR